MTSPVVITIEIDVWGEFRVPSPDGREASAYYTDDKSDALGTAKAIWGRLDHVKFNFKHIEGSHPS